MPRLITAGMQTHLNGPVQTMSLCWDVTRRDGEILYCTGHNRDLTIGGNIYQAGTSFIVSAMEAKSGLAVDNLEIRFPFGNITKADIIAKLYSGARLNLFWVNWDDLTDGKIYEAKGWILGEGKIGNVEVAFDLMSKAKYLETSPLDIITPDCRYVFGLDDGFRSRCPANLDDYLVTGAVSSVTDRRTFVDTSRTETSDIFAYGKLTFTSGDNTGYSMEVESYDHDNDRIITLFDLPYAFQVGDAYNLWRGCDRKAATCKNLGFFADFGGCPHVPDKNTALQYAVPK